MANQKTSRIGLDEMNLAEFPITTLWDEVPDGVKTLVFRDEIDDDLTKTRLKREVMVSGSDAYGLPTATDDAIVVALIELTRMKNNFTDRRVEFTRYELLKILGWPSQGNVFKRIEVSLHRWVGVTLYYKMAWRNNDEDKWETVDIHILESVKLYDSFSRLQDRAREKEHKVMSEFVWGEEIFKSFRANYLKKLDLVKYFEDVKLPIARRLYRFLDKRFHARPVVNMPLATLAFEKIGLSRKYPTGKAKQLIDRALAELEKAQVVAIEPAKKRYYKKDEKWYISIRKWKEVVGKSDGSPDPDLDEKARNYWVSLDQAGQDRIDELAEARADEATRLSLKAPGIGRLNRQILRLKYIIQEMSEKLS